MTGHARLTPFHVVSPSTSVILQAPWCHPGLLPCPLRPLTSSLLTAPTPPPPAITFYDAHATLPCRPHPLPPPSLNSKVSLAPHLSHSSPSFHPQLQHWCFAILLDHHPPSGRSCHLPNLVLSPLGIELCDNPVAPLLYCAKVVH
jgi:hypothetical protein